MSVCIWCSADVVFTCTLVLGCQKARMGFSAKYELLEQIVRYWVGQSKQEYTWGKRTSKRHSLTLYWGPWRTYSRGAPRRRLFKYVQSYSCVIARMKETCHEFLQYVARVLPWLSCILELNYNTDWCLFSQVKNRPWLPWVYSWIQHIREQLVLRFVRR